MTALLLHASRIPHDHTPLGFIVIAALVVGVAAVVGARFGGPR